MCHGREMVNKVIPCTVAGLVVIGLSAGQRGLHFHCQPLCLLNLDWMRCIGCRAVPVGNKGKSDGELGTSHAQTEEAAARAS